MEIPPAMAETPISAPYRECACAYVAHWMENFPRCHRARLAARNLPMEFPGKQWKSLESVYLQLSYNTLQKSHLPCHESKKNTGPERTREASSSCNVYPERSNIKLTLYQLTKETYSRVHLQEHKAGQRRGN